MNKTELIDALAARYEGNRKQAQHALESVLDTITREVAKGEKVAITGFGSFEKAVRNARWVRNPQTGERIKSKKKAVPKFSAGKELKDVISGAKKLPKLTAATMPKPPASVRAAAAAVTGATAKKSAPAKTATATSPTATKKSAPAKKTATKSTSTAKKSAPAKKTATTSTSTAKKSAPAKKTATTSTSTAKKSAPAKKTATKTTAAKTTTAKKAPATKAPAKKTTAKTTTAKKTAKKS
ncbi:HU family DNA-binding protein [Nocardioides KLBMP 9356]|uniref:HU family DNA-binding protein n=1 Tax=Nocardioides potassii TaxID=2911371 RepID=A0ABS9HA70_9ACTN|nr:HU family DNA-binding protein [Nocardioides potassii]MCF6377119.1 HU family DNA-binding protein [Nocardioides potassii]